MIDVLQFNPGDDFTLSQSYADIASVENQAVNFSRNGTYSFQLNITGLCQKNPLLHKWQFAVVIDNYTLLEFPVVSIQNSDISSRTNLMLATKGVLNPASHDVRIQWRKIEGEGQLNMDPNTQISLIIN